MYKNLQQNYLESEVLTADPLKLVELLYRGAIDAIQIARTAVKNRDIKLRSRQIGKALAIVNELALSLDHSRAEHISRQLVELYDYMGRRLVEANIQQIEAPLAEVSGLLATLLEGWQTVERPIEQTPPANRYVQAAGADYEPIQCSF
jgi:flagellar secretion chaperone FliS